MFVDPEKDPLSPPMSPGSDMAHCRKYKNLTDRQIRYLSGRYDGGVRWVDEALVPFFEFLERSDLLSRTVVVITSDHGEEFFEHGGSDHGLTLFREQLMIPLIIAAPDARAGRIEGLVGLSDVTPTVLDLAGQPTPAGLDGRSLARWIRGRTTGAAPSEAQVSTLIKAVSALQKEPARSFSWLDESEHLIVDEARHETWLFDLSEDEEETTNRAERTPERAARSTARLLAFRERFADRGHANVSRKAPSAAEAERLRSLGYIED
jgi:arylsulfatase A-like enzyme